jgi:tetratricopeptide (TPR) repeat protein/tRNA A-37 threonylcarbamoyl transferase component Bud32
VSAMTDEQRIWELVQEVLDTNKLPEEVCAECPELLWEIQRRMTQARRVESELEALFPSSDSSSQDAIEARRLPLDGPMPTIPGYEVESVLGHGGMGVVYKARHLKLNRPVALKMMIYGACATPSEQARFQREAEAVAALHHSNIVQIYDVGEAGGRPYYTMEFLEGGSLARKLAGKPQPAAAAAAYSLTLAEAVQAAHNAGIVHRDLKPANILLTADGVLKISDFGLARRSDGGQSLSLTAAKVGTPSYMAPEQALGKANAFDPAVDIYALGALLYEILTGRPPFRAETAAETQRQVVAEDPAPPSRLNANVPRDLETICLKCLQKEPDRRYGSAAVLADDLRRFVEGRPIRARPVGWVERAWRWSRRKPAAAALIVTALALLALATGGGIWLVQQHAERRAEAALHEADLRNDVSTAIAQAEGFRKDFHFSEAHELLDQARVRLAQGGPDDLRQRANQSQADLDLVEQLDAARIRAAIPVDGKFDPASAERHYTAALAAAGLGREGDNSATVAAAIRASAVHEEIVAALDDWASITQTLSRRAWLLSVARKADPDSARDRLRQAKLWQDGAKLTRLAKELSVAAVSPQLATSLGRVARHSGGDAVALLTAAQARWPQDFWLNTELGFSLAQAHRYEESLSYRRAALAARPKTSAAYLAVGAALKSLHRLDEAIDYYREAVRLDPQYAVAHFDLSTALLQKGRVDESIDQSKLALAIDPKLAAAHVELGSALFKKGQFDDAVEHLRQAIELDPRSVPAHNNLGVALVAKGRLNDAIDQLEQSIRLDPKASDAQDDLGTVLEESGRIDAAIDHFRQAVKLDPNNATAHNNLGRTLGQKGKHDEAIDQLKRAVALNPKLGNARASLGVHLRAKGRIDDAIKELQQAVNIIPNDAAAHVELASALFDKGRLQDDVDQLREALRLDPNLGFGERAFTDGMFAAARASVQLAAGKGADDKLVGDSERVKRRQQALEWLRADLEVVTKLVKNGRAKAPSLSRWQTDPALSTVRDSTELAKLPEAERKEWEGLWADVAALMAADDQEKRR